MGLRVFSLVWSAVFLAGAFLETDPGAVRAIACLGAVYIATDQLARFLSKLGE